MSPSPAEFALHLRGILNSTQSLPDEAKAPILHYRRTVADIRGTIDYVERLAAERDRPSGEVERHVGRLSGMALFTLIEALERFLKEVAAECVDRLAGLVALSLRLRLRLRQRREGAL
jgi:hypothetical protein